MTSSFWVRLCLFAKKPNTCAHLYNNFIFMYHVDVLVEVNRTLFKVLQGMGCRVTLFFIWHSNQGGRMTGMSG